MEKAPVKTLIKRDGSSQDYDPVKMKKRLENLMDNLNSTYVEIEKVEDKIMQSMKSTMKTSELDTLISETCAYLTIDHPDYSVLGARVAVTLLHKETKPTFFEAVEDLRNYTDTVGRPAPLISEEVYEIVKENKEEIEQAIDWKRDLNYDFFGYKTLERSYLLRIDGKIAERPQTMIMRVSIGIHQNDIKSAIQTYNLMSEKFFTHATPTLFNSGTPHPQMSSCFLLTMQADSIDGIYDTLKQCAVISKNAGGIGLAVHSIRSTDSYIRGTNGHSNGLVPMLRVFNDTARYVDQGGGKRKGAFAVYLEPWHADVYDFLDLRKTHGKEEQRARDLFYALWTPDLFMKRVDEDGDWTLMCPNECPGLHEVWGTEFEELYTKYESEGRGRKTIKARHLWNSVIESQIETGTPYMLYKDQANRKSNQQNLGTIKSSNLCTEIMEYTSKDEVAVCNLASLSLPKYVKEDKTYDYEKLHEVTKIVTRNLNKVIDRNFYPVKEAKNSNMRHRPIGIGVQGLADAYQRMKVPFESEEAQQINKYIFETIYHAAMESSMEIAMEEGHYESFQGSPLSKGKFQFDLWEKSPASDRYDWDQLRKDVMKHGARNSLLVAPMPTASTSQILRNNESFEPYTSNVYTRRVLAGEFICINPHLIEDLLEKNLWTKSIKNKVIAFNGSIQNIKEIPDDIKMLYKTVWEIPQKDLINLAVDRGPFICQSQSLNVYMAEPTFSKMTSMHFYAWKNGLKTGQYYFRTRPAADAIKFTVDAESLVLSGDSKAMQEQMKINNSNNPENIGKKKIRVKRRSTRNRKDGKGDEKESKEDKKMQAPDVPQDVPMVCPLRAPDNEDGPCFSCSG